MAMHLNTVIISIFKYINPYPVNVEYKVSS